MYQSSLRLRAIAVMVVFLGVATSLYFIGQRSLEASVVGAFGCTMSGVIYASLDRLPAPKALRARLVWRVAFGVILVFLPFVLSEWCIAAFLKRSQ